VREILHKRSDAGPHIPYGNSSLCRSRRRASIVPTMASSAAGLKLPVPARKAVFSALSERDETASICRDADGKPEPDTDLRDTESNPPPADDDPADSDGVTASVRTFCDREVQRHVSDAWIDTGRRDPKDGLMGLIGYEINFDRYFYRYTPPRPLEEIEADLRAIEKDIVRMLAEVTGTKGE
jgi:type I restriction enzyme M protein